MCVSESERNKKERQREASTRTDEQTCVWCVFAEGREEQSEAMQVILIIMWKCSFVRRASADTCEVR